MSTKRIVKHATSNLIRSLTTQELVAVFDETTTLLNNSVIIDKALADYQDGAIDGDELLDAFEDYGNAFRVEHLNTFSKAYCSSVDELNKYLEKTMTKVVTLEHGIRVVKETYCEPDEEETKALRDTLYAVISGLSFFLYHEFALQMIIDSANAGALELDEIVFSYCGENNKDAEKVASTIAEYVKQYKMSLEIFDEYPEKEIEFEKIMGPYVVGVAEERLTLELVDKVLTGVITPEELCKLTQLDDDQED